MRCYARTNMAGVRCKNSTKFLFCSKHRWGWWIGIIAFLFLTFPGLIINYGELYNKYLKPERIEGIKDKKDIVINKEKNKALKIIILPLKNLTEIKKEYDVILSDRIKNLITEDSLDLEFDFITDYNVPTNFLDKTKDSLLTVSNADFLVWGNYSVEKGADFLSLYYYSKKWKVANNNKPELNEISLKDFASGKLQGKLDFIVYYLNGLINLRVYVNNEAKKGQPIVINQSVISKYLRNAIYSLNKAQNFGKIHAHENLYELLGLSYIFSNQLDSAIKFYKKHLLESPKDLFCRSNLAVAYNYNNMYKDAVEEIDKCILYYPNDPFNYFQKAAIYRSKGFLEESISNLSKAIQIDTSFYSALYFRSTDYFKKGSRENKPNFTSLALVDINKVLDKFPVFYDAYKIRADIYAAKKNYLAAINDLTLCINYNTDESSNYYSRAVYYWYSHNNLSALNDIDMAILKNPNDPKFFYWRGIIFLSINQPNKALDNFEKAVDIDPNDQISMINIIYTLSGLKRFPEALEKLIQLKAIKGHKSSQQEKEIEKKILTALNGQSKFV